MKSCVLTRSPLPSFKFRRRSYSSLGGCKGESACVGKYAGDGGTSEDVDILRFGIREEDGRGGEDIDV
jgi:hypothetical protein